MSEFVAHLAEGGCKKHALKDHLLGVGKLAEGYASAFGNGDWAKLAGLWHDLGKYNPEFQHYLKEVAGQNAEDAHLEDIENPIRTRGPDHSTAGAVHAVQRMGASGNILAYMIAGHHAGLADWDSNEGMAQGALGVRLRDRGEKCLNEAKGNVPDDILSASLPTSPPPSKEGFALWIRMLFSCLVDADFLDTEKFMRPDIERGGYPSIEELRRLYHQHMATMTKTDTEVNCLRADILSQSLEKAKEPAGLFSLTVPTGGGKTLASLGFALEHAATHNKQRIIYVIPYTSIIEQTADVFKQIFGDRAVIEHHSQFDAEKAGQDTTRQRLASENWDAPLIVTTNVQFFESLYAARTSRVRKLHNIADSVVILDEAQLLPPELLDPIRHVMNELMRHYGVTFVLSTATQPVLDTPPLRPGAREQIIFPERREIIDNPKELYRKLKRVGVKRPPERRSWEDLAPELEQYERVLCIVSRRDDCRQLHALMPEETIHLSALMCGEHRSEVIKSIKARLQGNVGPVRVISTQLVEAGVDFDFPVVYRAMAGLDAIAQAAGRCNREGKLGGLGKVVVFIAPKDAPRGLLAASEQAGKFVLRTLQTDDDPLQPEFFEAFFGEFYGSVARGKGYDRKHILDCLKPNGELKFAFRTAAQNFQMVEDHYLPVIVQYGKGKDIIQGLRSGWLDKKILRKAQRYSVTIPRMLHSKLLAEKGIEEISDTPGVYVQVNENLYHPTLGFMPERSMDYGAADLIG